MELIALSVIERAAHVTLRLARGETLTARQVSEQYGISRQWAHAMLAQIAYVTPLHSCGGVWRLSDVIRG